MNFELPSGQGGSEGLSEGCEVPPDVIGPFSCWSDKIGELLVGRIKVVASKEDFRGLLISERLAASSPPSFIWTLLATTEAV